jgi:predicted phage tail protein
MATILLSGSLAKAFGRFHVRCLDSHSVWEIFNSLKATLPGFEEEIRRLHALGIRFAIFKNRRNVNADVFGLEGARELRIVPVIDGGKRAGSLQTIIGIVLIAAGLALTGGLLGVALPGASYLIPLGTSLVAGGIIQMLSPQLSGLSQSAAPENLPSYAFGSARNTTASGNNVPICIGERRWGGSIISASIYAEDRT